MIAGSRWRDYSAILVQVPETMKNLLIQASLQRRKLVLFYRLRVSDADVVSVNLGYVGASELWVTSADPSQLSSMSTPCWVYFEVFLPTFCFTFRSTKQGLTIACVWRRAASINVMVHDVVTAIKIDG